MAPLRRNSIQQFERECGSPTSQSGSMLRSPVTAAASTSSSSSVAVLPSFLARVTTPRRRHLVRSVGGGAGLFLLVWTILILLGAFDTNLRISPHIDPRTFQVRPAGDPLANPLEPYVKPPDYYEFQAEWNAPSYELLTNAPPSSRKCDKKGPLLFIGLFTHPQGAGRRQILRALFKPDLIAEGHRIEFKFILGQPPDDDWRYQMDMEQALNGDMIILEEVVKDNIDEGKSIQYFQWLVKNLPDPKPQYVMKMDDDTFLVMPNVIRSLTSLDCSDAIYWGTTQGSNIEFFGRYMRGLCYGMSWPLASWLGTANVSSTYVIGAEDAKIGKMINSLDPHKEPVLWVDHGWKMGDWDQIKVDADLIGFHWLKMDHWVPMVKRKALAAFKEAGRSYRWDWDRMPAGSTQGAGEIRAAWRQ